MPDRDLIETPFLEMPEDEQVKIWDGRIKLGRYYMERHGNQRESHGGTRWDNNVKAMAGDFNSVAELGEEAIDVNVIRANAKIMLGPLTLADPYIAVNPTKEETNEGGDNLRNAEVTEIELNYWGRELEIKRSVRKAVNDCFSTNHGYAYVGRTLLRRDAYDSGERGELRMENDPTIKYRQPFVRRLSPKQVIVPPGYWDLEEAPWIALEFLQPLRHVAKKFDVDPDDIPTTSCFDVDQDDEAYKDDVKFQDYMQSGDVENVRVLNIWCKETRRVYVMAAGDKKYLEKPKPWPWEVEGFPIQHLQFERIADEFQGTPTQTYMMPQQYELNAARTSMRKRFNRSKSGIFVSDEVDKDVVDNWQRQPDGSYLRIPVPSGSRISDMVLVDQGLPFDQHSLAYGNVIQSDMIAIGGVSAEQRGAGDPNVDSATASANIQQNVNIRNSERGDAVREFYIGIYKKLWMILKSFPNEERTRRIAGDRLGQFRSVSYTTDELHGEFEFRMDFSAMMHDVPATRATRAINMYMLFRQDPLVNPNTLIHNVLATQNVKNPEQWMLQLRTPQEELQLMLQGMPVEAHDRDDQQEHLEQHEAQSMELQRRITAAIQQFGASDENVVGPLRDTQILLTAHAQDHMARVARIQGQQQSPQGNTRDVTKLRQGVKEASGEETAAELAGQPLIRSETLN